MTTESGRSKTRRQRWILPVLALLFMGPLAAAWFFYYAGDGWRPGESVNHGQLITPAVPLPLPVDGAWPELSEHWSLLVVGNGPCDLACVAVLDKVRRVRLALREKAPRVTRVLLHAGELQDSDAIREQRAGLLALRVDTERGRVLHQQLSGLVPASGGSWAIFVVDPLGNAVLVYTPDFTMRGMLADLKRLLKLSRIG